MRDLALLPPPVGLEGIDPELVRYLDVQFKRIEEHFYSFLVPAANVTSGTFNGGDYVFPAKLTTTGRITAANGVHITSDWLRVSGNTGLYFETWAGGWFMQDTNWIRAHNDKSVYTGGLVGAGNARMGNHPFWGANFAWFGHGSYDSSSTYCLLQEVDGTTYINAPSLKLIRFLISNVLKASLSADIFSTHGVPVYGDRPTFQNGWANSSIHVVNTGAGNADVGYSWHNPNQRAGNMFLGTDGIFRLQGSWTTWPRFDCDVNDMSSADSKENIRPIEEGALAKVKRLKPIKFKRKEDPRIIEKWEQEVADGVWNQEAVEVQRKDQNKEMVGFTAEEMAEVFPEVVAYNPVTGAPDGIRYRLMVAPIVKAIQELDARIDALETKTK